MAYQDDLYHIMTSDTSLNTLVNNRIFFETLEENYDITKDWIVFSFRKASQVDCINSKNAPYILDIFCYLLQFILVIETI